MARSAASYGRECNAPWVEQLRHVACIGTPNLGAPLEKAVNLLTRVLRKVDAAGARVPSASGETSDVTRRIPFSSGKVFPGMNHIHLANHPDIYEVLRDFFVRV